MTIKANGITLFVLLSSISLPNLAMAGGSVELSPGLWQVNHVLRSPSKGVVHRDSQKFCLTPKTATITFEQILAELNWAQCRASDVVITKSTGRANINCVYPEYGGARSSGKMVATYSKNSYRLDSKMTGVGVGIKKISHTAIGKRIGEC